METRKKIFAKDVAERYGCVPETVKTWARNGKIPGYQTGGGKWYFYEDELLEADKERAENSLKD